MSMTKEQLALLGIKVDKDELTEDEVVELINKKFAEKDSEIKNQKDLLTKRNGEIAEWKRKETEKLSEEEKTRLHYEELERTNQELSRRIAMSERIANYVAIGYPKELAEKIATAELDGKDTTKYHSEYRKQIEAEIRAEVLQQTPPPNTNNETQVLTKADFDKMSYSELMKLKTENPAEYERLSKE